MATETKTTSNNSLYGVTGKWVGDSGDGGSFSVDYPSREIIIQSSSRGVPFNVMFNTSQGYNDKVVSNNYYYYEVHVSAIKGNISIGFVKSDEFLPGWKLKGMFYNGCNVTNGSAALLTKFGPQMISANDTIGVLISKSSSNDKLTFRTTFYLNKRCLGTAFLFDQSEDENSRIINYYPCIHITGEATINYDVPMTIPKNIDNREEEILSKESTYLGSWEVDRMFVGPELGEYPLPKNNRNIIFTFTKMENANDDGNNNNVLSNLRLMIKVSNTIHCSLNIAGKDSDNAFDKIEVDGKGMISTQMLPPPEMQKIEKLMMTSIPTLYKMIVNEKEIIEETNIDGKKSQTTKKETLIMTGPAIEFIAHRYVETFTPLTSYH